MNYLTDTQFLQLLDNEKNKTQYGKIIILDFKEQPIKVIQGILTSGSINVNGASSVRRTLTLGMNCSDDVNKITNIENIISINKKIKVEVGYKNNFSHYSNYGEIIWFKCGTYIIDKCSLSENTTGFSINIQGKDKMSQLDGTVGGTIPASLTLHEKYIIDKEGNITVQKPVIYEIIQEVLVHFGGEFDNNIFINDLEMTAKQLVKYIGDDPIYFTENHDSFIITSGSTDEDHSYKYINGQDIGYMETPMTYPGELTFNAGATVTQILDEIVKTLGSVHEYYYDIDGRFIFQEIKDYQITSFTPIVNLKNDSYVKHFSDSKYYYTFTDKETVTQVSYNPNYNNIKNDFVVWGSRETAAGAKIGIRYHLAIDEKPKLDLCNYHMFGVWENGLLREYKYYTNYNDINSDNIIIPNFLDFAPYKEVKTEGISIVYMGGPCGDWREELYRQALEASKEGTAASYYDEELLAEWRKLYNPIPQELGSVNEEEKNNWNSNVFNNPGSLDYWLDFIDTNSKLGEFSVNTIGRRSKVINNDKINTIYNTDVPDVIFFENTGDNDDLIEKYNNIGQRYCMLNNNQINYFALSSTGISAYDAIRELLYQHLIYNISINLSSIPRFYLEPNNLIYLRNEEAGIDGDYVIKNFSLPLTYNGTMSITLNEALVRI